MQKNIFVPEHIVHPFSPFFCEDSCVLIVGSFISLYQTATGRSPQHIFGKPDPTVLAPLLGRYAKEEMVMVGDRLSTDKKLAENAGIDFILVLSGEAVRADLEKEEMQPTLVVEDLGHAEACWR